MTSPEDRPVLKHYGRRRLLAIGLFVLLYGVPIAVLVLVVEVPLLWSYVGVLVVGMAAVRAPLVFVEERFELSTAKSPEEALAEFAGPDSPLMAVHRARADRVERRERGATFTYDGRLRTRHLAFETTGRPDGGIEGRFGTAGEEPLSTFLITVTDLGDRTKVVVETTTNRRFTVKHLVNAWILSPSQLRGYRRQGYEVERSQQHYSLSDPGRIGAVPDPR